MKVKLIILIGSIIMCTTFTACKTQKQNHNEVSKENKINEVVQNKKDMPVMSEESIQCIEDALGENSEHGVGIAEFVADVTSEKIVEAEMIE